MTGVLIIARVKNAAPPITLPKSGFLGDVVP